MSYLNLHMNLTMMQQLKKLEEQMVTKLNNTDHPEIMMIQRAIQLIRVKNLVCLRNLLEVKYSKLSKKKENLNGIHQ
jgi:hypothetical protein